MSNTIWNSPIEQDFKENVIGFARKRECNSICLQPGDVWRAGGHRGQRQRQQQQQRQRQQQGQKQPGDVWWAWGHRGEPFNERRLQGNCGVDPTEGVDSFGLYARPTI